MEHRNYKIIYRRYASLFFLVGVDGEEVTSFILHPYIAMLSDGFVLCATILSVPVSFSWSCVLVLIIIVLKALRELRTFINFLISLTTYGIQISNLGPPIRSAVIC